MEFFCQFKGLMEAYKHFGGTIGDQDLVLSLTDATYKDHPGKMSWVDMTKAQENHQSAINALTTLIQYLKDKETYKARIKVKARDQTLAMMYLQRVGWKRYSNLWADLHNLYSHGDNQYPQDLGQAYSIVSNHVKERTGKAKDDTRDNNMERRTAPETGVAFLQHKYLVPDAAGHLFPDVRCYKCNNYGHYATLCITPSNKRLPIPKKEGGKDTKEKPPDNKGQQMLQIKEEPETADDTDEEHGLMFIQLMDIYKTLPPPMEDWEESNSSDDETIDDDESVGSYGTESSDEYIESSDDEGDSKDRSNDNDTMDVIRYLDAPKGRSDNSTSESKGSTTEMGFMQKDQSKQYVNIPKHWVLLDS